MNPFSKKTPKKLRKSDEHDSQKLVVEWFKIQYPQHNNLLIHIPNGQNIGPIRGAELTRLGLVKGMPDLALFVPNRLYHALFIEMKSSIGTLSSAQKLVISKLKSYEYDVHVCRSFEDAQTVINAHLNNT